MNKGCKKPLLLMDDMSLVPRLAFESRLTPEIVCLGVPRHYSHVYVRRVQVKGVSTSHYTVNKQIMLKETKLP